MAKETKDELTGKQRLQAAFEALDAAKASPVVIDADVQAAQKEVTAAVHAYDHDGFSYDRAKEPVMADILQMSRSRNEFATRLLIGPLTHVNLYQKPKGEDPIHDEYVGANGIAAVIPRGRKVIVPLLFADILEQSGIR